MKENIYRIVQIHVFAHSKLIKRVPTENKMDKSHIGQSWIIDLKTLGPTQQLASNDLKQNIIK